MLNEQCIFLNLDFEDSESLLRYMSGELCRLGYVKDTFAQAVIDREKEYPTGLPTEHLKVAIPHTGAEHVKQQVVSIATLQKPVIFSSIEQDDEKLPVEIVFLLALSETDEHLNLLRTVMKVFQDDAFLQEIKAAQTPSALAALLADKLGM